MDTEMDDEDVIDLTNQPMSTVMKVFKKMGPEDQIEVQKDDAGNIHLTDNETDNEYMIMAESDMDEYFGDMDEEEYDEDKDTSTDTSVPITKRRWTNPANGKLVGYTRAKNLGLVKS